MALRRPRAVREAHLHRAKKPCYLSAIPSQISVNTSSTELQHRLSPALLRPLGGSECQFPHFMLTPIGGLNYFCWDHHKPIGLQWFSHCNIDRFSINHKRTQICPNTMLDPPGPLKHHKINLLLCRVFILFPALSTNCFVL